MTHVLSTKTTYFFGLVSGLIQVLRGITCKNIRVLSTMKNICKLFDTLQKIEYELLDLYK